VNDKEIEKNRYNNSAIGALENNSILNIDELMLKVADMEKLPFANQSFDIIVSAGSLSYGDNEIFYSLKAPNKI
jgi:hypothetical protein